MIAGVVLAADVPADLPESIQSLRTFPPLSRHQTVRVQPENGAQGWCLIALPRV